MKKLAAFVVLLALLALPATAFAQSTDLTLRVKRDFGYGGFDNRIQGRFTMEIQGPEDLTRVEFYIDDQLVDTQTAAPFEFQFHTDDYATGEHHFYALGESNSGAQLRSNEVIRVFLTAE